MNVLAVGMAKLDVQKALGSPSETAALAGREYWTYTFINENRNSLVRKVVVFDQSVVSAWGDKSAFPMRSSTTDERPHGHGEKLKP